jgi:arginine/lysine/ornithine decarboxylase
MRKSGVKTKRMSDPLTLELAKVVCDTSYYGWLINYAQISQIITSKYKVDYDEMWSFADEIHKFLGNRPKLFPGYIGGHCVIPNLELMNDYSLNQIKKINESFRKFKK